MTAFVVLAAGRGNRIGRVGDDLPKCLLPLGGRAVLDHQVALRPPGSRIVLVLGYRHLQVVDYVNAMYPDLDVACIYADDWNESSGGPGSSLLAARDAVGDDDMMFTSCDTLWSPYDDIVGDDDDSFVAVAPIPPGTPAARWCRVAVDPDEPHRAASIVDKQPDAETGTFAYTGMSFIKREHLQAFWEGIESSASFVAGERQVSGGLARLVGVQQLQVRHVSWTDVGDVQAYQQAVARVSGYDWSKSGQATYVVPNRAVVKFYTDYEKIRNRYARGLELHDAGVSPRPALGRSMMWYPYVEGQSGYDAAEDDSDMLLMDVIAWLDGWRRRIDDVPLDEVIAAATMFYRVKTYDRLAMLPGGLRLIAEDAVSRIDWDHLIQGCQPGLFHGDLNYGNIIIMWDGRIVGIDWREDFGGYLNFGDMRYDVAKLLAGCVVHWDNAQRGDFRPWDEGAQHIQGIRESSLWTPECEIIGALSLLNSAPLHAPPLDEILVARGCAWLGESL